MSLFTAIADRVLAVVESLVPLAPLPSPAEVEARKADGQWRAASAYYFLEDESARLGQRVRALARFDRASVSFWRKRRALLRSVRDLVRFGVVETYQEALARLDMQGSLTRW